MATPQLAWRLTFIANTIFYVLPKPLKRVQTWTGITGPLHTPKIYDTFTSGSTISSGRENEPF
jgi:hypothetical protein